MLPNSRKRSAGMLLPGGNDDDLGAKWAPPNSIMKVCKLVFVGRQTILAFEDAVITSRANKIALEYFDKGQLPPAPFPLDRLPMLAQAISPENIKSIMDWQHFVTFLETICLNNTNWGKETTSLIKPTNEFVEKSVEWNTWRECFHRSVYRSFLLGPVLCHVYQEPLVPATNQPKVFLDKFAERNEGRPSDLYRAEIDYLLTIPVFNLEAFETHEPVYGPLADFFIQQTQQLAATSMYPAEANPDSTIDRAHASAAYAAMVQCLLSYMLMWWDEKFFTNEVTKEPSHKRTLRLIRAIKFYPEEISMPVHPHDAQYTPIHQRYLHTERNTDRPAWTDNARYLEEVLDYMYGSSGQPNTYADDLRAPFPPLQIFQFIARRYLGLRFMDNAFGYDAGAPSDCFVSHPNTGQIYLGIWPERARSGWLGGPGGPEPMFDVIDGEREYLPYFNYH
ncbi:hypothetical protein FE257_003705 [Aspergillus nanangensis]|uniref:Uncharacterized protein n=1 Tax=Aspergillus nanangensis TaxID=2582783 RepID=A0AAD4CTW0_ASPNN|nr:hypothetical protein FE257_003705 [Aspergillus nanangensis]